MELFTYLQSGPQKYAIILCIVWIIIIIPVLIMLFKKRKKKADAFLNHNKDAAIIQIITKSAKEELASVITVKSVNGEKPTLIGTAGKNFYVLPGVNKISLKAEWAEFSLLARGNSKHISTESTIEIEAQANETYNLKYDIGEQKFIVEKM